MKKIFHVSFKAIAFFLIWAVCTSLIPIPEFEDRAIWRFWAELIPFLSIAAVTLVFWMAERPRMRLHIADKLLYNFLLGSATGIVWLGGAVGILFMAGVLSINGTNSVSRLWLWIVAALINTAMQEMLVRGYLYRIIKNNYSVAAAAAISTGLFTIAHGGAFEAGLIPVMNVLTMSLFMTAVLEYTNSLAAPITVHFIWNSIGAIILGGVSLADDYPHIYNLTISGSTLLSGGNYKIEGSIVVLVLNIVLTAGFVAAGRKKQSKHIGTA